MSCISKQGSDMEVAIKTHKQPRNTHKNFSKLRIALNSVATEPATLRQKQSLTIQRNQLGANMALANNNYANICKATG
jgi:uncharacterized membrane protein